MTQALAKEARAGGARIFEHTKVTAIGTGSGRVTGVTTTRGEIACERVPARASLRPLYDPCGDRLRG